MMPYSQRPMHMDCCGPRHWGPPIRECRRESKELLVEPAAKLNVTLTPADTTGKTVLGGLQELNTNLNTTETAVATGSGKAIIGGGCCVQISVEYMPAVAVVTVDSPTDQKCAVTVEVTDSEGCSLAWNKVFQEGYHVKESIITTYPGAQLGVRVVNAIARVRWCEIFSC